MRRRIREKVYFMFGGAKWVTWMKNREGAGSFNSMYGTHLDRAEDIANEMRERPSKGAGMSVRER